MCLHKKIKKHPIGCVLITMYSILKFLKFLHQITWQTQFLSSINLLCNFISVNLVI